MNFYIDYRQRGPETAADIAKPVQPQICDYLLILFFVLTASVVTFGFK